MSLLCRSTTTPPRRWPQSSTLLNVRTKMEEVATIPALTFSPDKDATNYFRAIVKSGEMSPRVLELTEHIIRMNPAHYTAW
jgi:hypothetical protein